MWRGDVILARGDIRTVALHHIIPVKGKQACEPKSFQSLRKLDRRTQIVHALEVSESSCAEKLRDRKPSLFNTLEIFDHTIHGYSLCSSLCATRCDAASGSRALSSGESAKLTNPHFASRKLRPNVQLAILLGTTHYDIFVSPALASTATQFLDAPMPKAK